MHPIPPVRCSTSWGSRLGSRRTADTDRSTVAERMGAVEGTRPNRFAQQDGTPMDGTQFDHMMKRLATTRLARLTALRGLAAGGVAALIGMRLTADEADAHHRQRKRTICHCSNASAASCRTLTKAKKKVRKHLQRHPCDYKGRCKGFSGCAPAAKCQNNNQCSGGQVCSGGQCVDCTSYTQCPGQTCRGGVCFGGGPCANSTQCVAPTTCEDPPATGSDRFCLYGNICSTNADCGMFPMTPICVLGICTSECVAGGAACPAGQSCQAGVCQPT